MRCSLVVSFSVLSFEALLSMMARENSKPRTERPCFFKTVRMTLQRPTGEADRLFFPFFFPLRGAPALGVFAAAALATFVAPATAAPLGAPTAANREVLLRPSHHNINGLAI